MEKNNQEENIIITKNAAKRVSAILNGEGKEGHALRVSVVGGGCSGMSYSLDICEEHDEEDMVIEFDHVKVYVDPKASMFLIGSEMDYTKDKFASRFVFHNPNEKSTCGCGESFNI